MPNLTAAPIEPHHRRVPRSATFALAFGALFALVCLPCAALGLGMTLAPTRPDQVEPGVVIFVFSLVVFGLPAVALLWVGNSIRTHSQRLAHLAALGMASSRLPLDQLARELRLSREQVRGLILEAVGKGKLVGRLDIEHDVFISAVAHEGVQQGQRPCPRCGAISTVTVAPGHAAQCRYCGARV